MQFEDAQGSEVGVDRCRTCDEVGQSRNFLAPCAISWRPSRRSSKRRGVALMLPTRCSTLQQDDYIIVHIPLPLPKLGCPATQQCGSSQCCSVAQYCSTKHGPAHCVNIPHFAGIGRCHPPVKQQDNTYTVTCNGPHHSMLPGEASAPDQTVLLGNPYPRDASVVVESMTSQMVDAANNPVPLSEVCWCGWV